MALLSIELEFGFILYYKSSHGSEIPSPKHPMDSSRTATWMIELHQDTKRLNQHLQHADLGELEHLFKRQTDLVVPRGRYAGHFLRRTDSWQKHPYWLRGFTTLGFEMLPFGIDFDRRHWVLLGGMVAAGRFEVVQATSRWRSTEVLSLRYEGSRLPLVIRSRLYDEVKPLGNGLFLGMGGVTTGDLFFFSLELLSKKKL